MTRSKATAKASAERPPPLLPPNGNRASGVGSERDLGDPFRQLTAPPTNETPAEHDARLAEQARAKAVSDEIDEMIRREHLESSSRTKGPPCCRVLLLGQSESGKSTLQRQFTLMHAPYTFEAERPSWRLVVFLNIVRSIQRILKSLNAGLDRDKGFGSNKASNDPSEDGGTLSPAVPGAPTRTLSQSRSPANYVAEMTLRLSPITSLEEAIIRKLIGPEERNIQLSVNAKSIVEGSGLQGVIEGSDREFFVRPEPTWKGKSAFLDRLRRGVKAATSSGRSSTDLSTSPAAIFDDKSDPGKIFNLCAADMIGLWNDPWVRSRLARIRVRLQEGPGFFLDDLERITALQYMPTDDDILRARIKTIGVSEYIFPEDIQGVEWRLYDVGGARTQRHAWVPYFDTVDSIIFLAPLSPFDQALPEDRKANCLEDSLLLWKELCSNKLLAKVPLVLFLNKSDLLRKKIEDGILVNHYVVSYGERPNTYESVVRYFTSKFEAIRRRYSPPERPVFTHITSCINQKTTKSIIAHVQDHLLRENLIENSLM